jgi:hypothetical protein
MESGGRAKNGGGELSLVGIHLVQDRNYFNPDRWGR